MSIVYSSIISLKQISNMSVDNNNNNKSKWSIRHSLDLHLKAFHLSAYDWLKRFILHRLHTGAWVNFVLLLTYIRHIYTKTCAIHSSCVFNVGWYWIDPDLGNTNNAVQVWCNFTAKETCVHPKSSKVSLPRY